MSTKTGRYIVINVFGDPDYRDPVGVVETGLELHGMKILWMA